VRNGRFNAPDSVYAGLFEPQAWNRYSYASSKYVDPHGTHDFITGLGTIGATLANGSSGVVAPFLFADTMTRWLSQRGMDTSWLAAECGVSGGGRDSRLAACCAGRCPAVRDLLRHLIDVLELA
jgi:hypothetical protein